MARRVNFIQEINASKDTWKLKVRVTGLWRVDRSSAPSIEMIFMDEKGDKIQAIVKNYHIAQWESQLHEGRSYIAENFEIFSTFEDILNGVSTTDILVDVIGELINIEMSQPDSTPKKVVFIMRDQRGNSLSCTLWGQFATQLLKYEQQDHKLGPIVLILTLAKIRDAKGGYPVTIQNTMYGSKLYINDNNIPEFQSFSSSLDTSKSYESYSQRMSQFSSCSQGGLQEKFFHNAVAKTIGEIIHVGQESVSVTYGTIDKLFANGWYYDGCSHCNRKTDAIRIPINCASCGRYLQEVVAR
ncbi:PREDICTED: uncharacterized protein LOC109333983 [Lupinus angustifolius]|uniref:uncharacterized protein LOC109333983 n=1 Tax=Lupinus angustifolius TaxID=3871 RepID=UPI00092F7022|nr:PREDICTED: uncharacterized protein LOC109333983 [Lupinus angustifolius]